MLMDVVSERSNKSYKGEFISSCPMPSPYSVYRGDGGLLEDPNDNETKTAFEWGRLSPGAIHLAEALLLDFLGNAEATSCLKFKFAERIISQLPENRWELTRSQVWEAIIQIANDEEANERPSPPALDADGAAWKQSRLPLCLD